MVIWYFAGEKVVGGGEGLPEGVLYVSASSMKY